MSWDVVVWGGGTGGVAAALQSARSGVSTLLLTPGIWLGGMLSAAGVSAPDGHELSCWQSGLWGALLRDLQEQTDEGLDHNWVSCFGFKPQQAEAILQHWVHEAASLTWWSQAELLDVTRQGSEIAALTVFHAGTHHRLLPSVVIDGSDLGDLMAMAEVPHRWGWEAQELWQEPSAPTRERLLQEDFFQQQPIQSPTWVVVGQLGEGNGPDHAAVPPEAPFQHCLDRFGLHRTVTYGRLPGGLVMLNWPLNGNDWHAGLQRSISVDSRQRLALAEEMQLHSKDFLAQLTACSDGWLQPGKAFPGSDPSLALMPYWREGRRLQGRETVTETDLLPISAGSRRGPLPLDDAGRCTSIAVGTYANDHHYPGDDWPLAAKSIRWGGRWTGTPFCIPYGALFADGISNLLMADKGFSVSHIANGATRLQPLILNIGQAAGMAAALAIQGGRSPSDLPPGDVQRSLIDDVRAPAAVMPLWNWPVWHPNWSAAQHRALQSASELDGQCDLDPATSTDLSRPGPEDAPISSRSRSVQGRFRMTAEDRWELATATLTWPLITLEPAVQAVLNSSANGTQVTVQATENPWGPWLRVERVAFS